MFWFLVKYCFKETVRNKSAIFWNLIFPFMMATVFGAVLLNLDEKVTKMEPIPIMAEDKGYETVFRMIEMNGESMFEVKSYKDPEAGLKAGEIIGFVRGKGKDAEVVLKRGNLRSTIFYNLANGINHTYQAVEEIMKEPENREKIAHLLEDIGKYNEVSIRNGMEGKNKKRFVTYFYSLMAMICLGAMPFGVSVVENTSIISDVKSARRRTVSPVGKSRLILADFVSSLIISSVSTLILFLYIRHGIGVEFGEDTLYLIIALLLGNLMAMLLGMLLSLIVKGKTETKISISAAFYVLSAALSGMMGTGLAGIINRKAPVVTHINPATMLTKMFTSLYLYEGRELYFCYITDIVIMIILSFALILFFMRRRSYDSI